MILKGTAPGRVSKRTNPTQHFSITNKMQLPLETKNVSISEDRQHMVLVYGYENTHLSEQAPSHWVLWWLVLWDQMNEGPKWQAHLQMKCSRKTSWWRKINVYLTMRCNKKQHTCPCLLLTLLHRSSLVPGSCWWWFWKSSLLVEKTSFLRQI